MVVLREASTELPAMWLADILPSIVETAARVRRRHRDWGRGTCSSKTQARPQWLL